MPRSILLVLLLGACVPKARYETAVLGLADTHDRLQSAITELDALRAEIATLQADLAAASARGDELDLLASDLADRNAGLSGRLKELQQMLADLSEKSAADRARKGELEGMLATLQQSAADAQAQADEARARLAALEAEKSKLEEKTAAYDALVQSLQTEIASGQVQITELRGKLTVNLSNAILFDLGSAQLRPDGRAALEKVAGVLAQVSDREIRVEGHTDNVPVKPGAPYADNWALSALRASTVTSLLVASGVDPKNITAVGFGEHSPVQPNDTEAGRAANRRTEIVLAPRLAPLPTVQRPTDGGPAQ